MIFIFETTQYFGDGMGMFPPQNNVKDIEEYKNLYQQAGFQILEFVDATDECWKTHFRYLKSWFEEEFQAGKVDEQTYHTNTFAVDRLLNSSLFVAYLLVSAKKPVKIP